LTPFAGNAEAKTAVRKITSWRKTSLKTKMGRREGELLIRFRAGANEDDKSLGACNPSRRSESGAYMIVTKIRKRQKSL